MAFTKAQAKVWATGTTAALKRQSDCETTYVRVTREPEIVEDEQIRGVLSWSLVERGPLPASTTRIEIVDIEYLEERLEQAEETIRRKDAEIAAMREAMAKVLPPPPPLVLEPTPEKKDTRWGTIRQAAELHGVSLTTMRRACKDGRIRCKLDPVKRYNHYLIDLDAPLSRSTGRWTKKK